MASENGPVAKAAKAAPPLPPNSPPSQELSMWNPAVAERGSTWDAAKLEALAPEQTVNGLRERH